MGRGLAILALGVLAFAANALAADDDRALSAKGDAGRGRIAFLTCQACHNLSPGGPVKLGPNLDNIFGRIAGTSPAYAGYSKALQESGIVWDERTLDEWLKNPQNVLPGTKMPFAGIRSDQERADLLAFLRAAGGQDAN